MVKIENREGSPDAPQDYIYSVDLLFAGEESLFEYFVENQLAVKVRIVEQVYFCMFKKYLQLQSLGKVKE